MKAFAPLIRAIRIAFNEWALSEINPTHRDLPEIVLKLRQLHDARAKGGAA